MQMPLASYSSQNIHSVSLVCTPFDALLVLSLLYSRFFLHLVSMEATLSFLFMICKKVSEIDGYPVDASIRPKDRFTLMLNNIAKCRGRLRSVK